MVLISSCCSKTVNHYEKKRERTTVIEGRLSNDGPPSKTLQSGKRALHDLLPILRKQLVPQSEGEFLDKSKDIRRYISTPTNMESAIIAYNIGPEVSAIETSFQSRNSDRPTFSDSPLPISTGSPISDQKPMIPPWHRQADPVPFVLGESVQVIGEIGPTSAYSKKDKAVQTNPVQIKKPVSVARCQCGAVQQRSAEEDFLAKNYASHPGPTPVLLSVYYEGGLL